MAISGGEATGVELAKQVADWLLSLKHRNVVTMQLTVGNQVFYGCSYDFVGTYTDGMLIVRRGEKVAGDEYTSSRLYFVGDLPKVYLQTRGKVCFMYEGRTFFVSGYILSENIKANTASYHPFGTAFTLGVWDEEKHGPIDAGEKSYRRVSVELVELER